MAHLLRVEERSVGVSRRREGAEEVGGKHVDNLGVKVGLKSVGNLSKVLDKLCESRALDLLGLEVAERLCEVKHSAALSQLYKAQKAPK